MNDLQAIENRKSRRVYSNTPIESKKLFQLEQFIQQCNEASGLSIQLVADGSAAFGSFKKSYGIFTNVKTLIAFVGKSNDEHLKEKVGYYGEKLVLEATKMELGTCWVGGTFNRDGNIVNVGTDEALVCVIPVGNVAEEAFKEKLIHKIAARKTKKIEDFYTAEGTVPSWFMDGMKAVQKAPSAINSQKVHFTLSDEVIRVSIPDNSKFDLIDLGIAKLHFEMGADRRFEFGNNAEIFLMCKNSRIV